MNNTKSSIIGMTPIAFKIDCFWLENLKHILKKKHYPNMGYEDINISLVNNMETKNLTNMCSSTS